MKTLRRALPRAFALLVFASSAARLFEAFRVLELVRQLPGAEDTAVRALPHLSVIVPARDEEPGLKEALGTLLGQDYPGPLEIVLVDDRSTDGTARVMEGLAAGRDDVAVMRTKELPSGWLGKNHAIHSGASRARGGWLLFTDADVRFAPNALSRAVRHAERTGLHHLTMIPGLVLPGYWLQSFVAFFYAAFLVHRGYYKANIPGSRTGVGIGAFNHIRRDAYEKVGGYSALRERPDDDLTLGVRMKRFGLSQELRLGQDLLSVQWYGSVGEMLRGVEKNVFAALDYSLPTTLGYVLALPPLMVGPFVAAAFSRSRVRRTLYLASAAAQLATFALANRHLGPRALWLALGYPVCALVFVYAIARSAALVLARGGVWWRGTFYPSSLLENTEINRSGTQEGKW